MAKLICIGIAIDQSYSYCRDVLRGISRYAEAKRNWLCTSILLEKQRLKNLRRPRLDALIVSVDSREMALAIRSWRRPAINIGSVVPELSLPRVGVDNTCVGRMAVDHFLERGLRHFGYFGPPDHQYSMERYAAFRQALQEAGHTVACYHTPAHLPLDPHGRQWNLEQGVYRWLRRLPKPVGVFTADDDWGLRLAEACRLAEQRVPEAVAILGVDDDDLDCELARPQLSSVILAAEQIGYEAAAILDRWLAGKKPPADPLLLPPIGVATRRSTELLAVEDIDVVAAVRFIREHAHLPLRVDDVLEKVPAGRRTLERRCHKALGWGLGEEIRRAHMDLARRLLARTQLPIKTVAQQAGFTGISHMGVMFRRELGMSPSAYRRQMGGEADEAVR